MGAGAHVDASAGDANEDQTVARARAQAMVWGEEAPGEGVGSIVLVTRMLERKRSALDLRFPKMTWMERGVSFRYYGMFYLVMQYMNRLDTNSPAQECSPKQAAGLPDAADFCSH